MHNKFVIRSNHLALRDALGQDGGNHLSDAPHFGLEYFQPSVCISKATAYVVQELASCWYAHENQ
jgi:hypothetical protein